MCDLRVLSDLNLNYRAAHRLGTFPRSSSLALRIRTGTPASSAARDSFSKSAELGVAGGSASAAAATATTAAPTRAFRRASGTLAHAEEPDDDDAALELLESPVRRATAGAATAGAATAGAAAGASTARRGGSRRGGSRGGGGAASGTDTSVTSVQPPAEFSKKVGSGTDGGEAERELAGDSDAAPGGKSESAAAASGAGSGGAVAAG